MLTDQAILIVEDNAYIAIHLAMAVEDLEGCVVGPVGAVEDAIALVREVAVAAAILDCELTDRDITPLALHLIEADIPFVFHTGTVVPQAVLRVRPNVTVLLKPAHPEDVLSALVAEMSRAQPGE